MNVVFWFLVLLALILVWFLLSGAFKPLGEFVLNLFNGAKKGINDNDENNEYDTTNDTNERIDF